MNSKQQAIDDAIAGGAALSAAAINALAQPDIGAIINAGLNVNADAVQASTLTLVKIIADDSSSMSYVLRDQKENPSGVSNIELAREGVNAMVESLAKTKQRDEIWMSVSLLNRGVVSPFGPISDVAQMTERNYPANGCTPLYAMVLASLIEVSIQAQSFVDQGIPCRTVTWVVTDGANYTPSGDPKGKVKPDDVYSQVLEMNRQEGMHIFGGMGIQDGTTDFEDVFSSMGIEKGWMLTPKNTPSEIRKACAMMSQSAVRASQNAQNFSQLATGGLAGFGL